MAPVCDLLRAGSDRRWVRRGRRNRSGPVERHPDRGRPKYFFSALGPVDIDVGPTGSCDAIDLSFAQE